MIESDPEKADQMEAALWLLSALRVKDENWMRQQVEEATQDLQKLENLLKGLVWTNVFLFGLLEKAEPEWDQTVVTAQLRREAERIRSGGSAT
jgi:hypothetical protein